MLEALGVAALLLANQTVMVGPGSSFTDESVTVHSNETVTWVHAGGSHNVHFEDESFVMPEFPSSTGWPVMRQFTTPGTFRYYCDAHGGPGGAGMSGTVVVLGPGGAPPPGPGPAPGPAPPGGDEPSPPTRTRTRITLAVSDRTPRAGRRVRFSGFVSPARDGARLQLQRRTRRGWRTVKVTRLRDAGTRRSKFAIRIRVRADGRYRARLPATRTTSRSRRVNVV